MSKNETEKKTEDENEPQECPACGGPIMTEKVNLEDYQGGKLYMMEQIPAKVCQNCGEVWLPETAMNEFEDMIKLVKAKKKIGRVK
ncbi:MAG: type II toxin-antitoxin system MqsA family antitoxin [bacterium]